MLKRLELIGFKSFADRTRFDFAPGITAIVGPNGSGKSNIVDAVKWILGEQSAKSLRGGEMADVIFNGSSTRKSLGMAEVTMTFDNAKRALQFDGDEVQITRRVYRDGQGEYLINGQLSRLKDIKEMFLGSGAGHGAYSIIEQGRVDALLLASVKDRRQIFEEAAGISRFKAKKTEALKKLEATELNLNRVKDILQELEKALKTLQSQATKARKFQEFQERLKSLRVGLGLREFQDLTQTLAYQEELLTRLRSEVSEATARIDADEAALRDLDAELARTDDALRTQEKGLGEARQIIAEQDAAAKSQREQAANLEADTLKLGRQRTDLIRRMQTLTAEAVNAKEAADAAELAVAAEQHTADAAAAALNVVMATIAELARQTQAARDEQFALVGRAAQLKSSAEMTVGQVERLRKELVRKKAEGEKATAEAEAIGRVTADLTQDNAAVQDQLKTAHAALAAMQQKQAEQRRQAETLQPRLDERRDRRGDLRGRADVLEQLERSHEGFGAGVKAVLEHRQGNSAILGLVADLLSVPREYAPLIDLALGDIAQRFVVDADALDAVIASFPELPGRVGFIPLASGGRQPPESSAGYETLGINVDEKQNPGTDAPCSPVGFVTSPLPGLVEQLLGNVKIVESLSEARRTQGSGHRFIARTGEILEPDGTVVVGPSRGEAGILSRKSELRELRDQLAALDVEVSQLEAEQGSLRREADAMEAPIGGRTAEIAALTDKAGDLRDSLTAQREKQARLGELIGLVTQEAAILDHECQSAETALRDLTESAAEAERSAADMKATLEATETQLRLAESTREARQQENTAAQVKLTQTRQQAATLAARRTELDAELRQRDSENRTLAQDAAATATRQSQCELAALRAGALAATAYGRKDEHERGIADLSGVRDKIRHKRDTVQDGLRQIRDAWKQRQDQAHAHELTVRDLTNRRLTIEARLRDDYAIELTELAATPPETAVAAEQSDDEIQIEIDDLKKKIARLGSVNLEALEQLEAEEGREKTLRAEFDDLTAAQASLLEIIETINTDSRRLFTDMLATVRVHFQELFRKLFGGGMADIILEDPLDVLETGIEITARPPGKELRSISLLSGGEKTLTAVALLLAIFRSKPSPFCLLDEVDAALDEANTARLSSVLREFLDQSQFIIITHKKRTMAMADVLYGITMQESGISKQVATRIEDWPDDEPAEAAA